LNERYTSSAGKPKKGGVKMKKNTRRTIGAEPTRIKRGARQGTAWHGRAWLGKARLLRRRIIYTNDIKHVKCTRLHCGGAFISDGPENERGICSLCSRPPVIQGRPIKVKQNNTFIRYLRTKS
jgi:hypothetical protein